MPGDPITLMAVGVVLLVALVVAARLVVAPAVTAGLLVAVVVSDISSVVGSFGPASVYLLTLGLAVATLGLAVASGALRLHWSPFFLLAAIWLATRAVSVLGAGNVAAGRAELVDEAKGFVLLVVLTMLLVGIRSQVRVMALSVVVVAALAGLTLAQEFVLGDSTALGGLSGIGVASEVAGLGARHSGTQSDPNFWGRILVMFLPLSLALLWGRRRGPAASRLPALARVSPRWWLLAVVALLGGEYLSQSRGGLIAAFATTVLTLALLVRNRVRLIAGAIGLVLVLTLLPGVGSRLGTLASLNSPTATGVVDQSLLGREAAQQAGLAMFRDSPLLGIGAGNFEIEGRSYQRKLGLTSLSVDQQLLAPHDLYVQMLAEGGLVGLLGWLVFYFGSLVLMLRARRSWRELNGGTDGPEARLCAAVAASLGGWGVASLFLHLANLPVLLVVVAFGAALHLRARFALAALPPGGPTSHTTALAGSPDVPPELGLGRSRRLTLVVVGLTLLAGSAFAGRTAVSAPEGWSSSAVVNVAPSDLFAGPPAYAYSVLSRTITMPTLVTLAVSPRFLDEAVGASGMSTHDRQVVQLSALRPPGASTFRLSVTTRGAEQSGPLLDSTVDRVRTYLRAQRSLYQVQITQQSSTERVGGTRTVEVVATVLLGVLGLLALIVAARGPAGRIDLGDDFDETRETATLREEVPG